MACYTSDEYVNNHKHDYVIFYIGLIFLIFLAAIIVMIAVEECHSRTSNSRSSYESEDVSIGLVPSAPVMSLCDVGNQGDNSNNNSNSMSSYGYGTVPAPPTVALLSE